MPSKQGAQDRRRWAPALPTGFPGRPWVNGADGERASGEVGGFRNNPKETEREGWSGASFPGQVYPPTPPPLGLQVFPI